jgi:hypothetical protein
MNIVDKDKDGNMTILGIPVGVSGAYSKEGRMGQFQPTDPSLLVPRKFGAGWDLNLGALAVKMGLIGPNVSFEEVEDDIPEETLRKLEIAPIAGAAAVALTALAIGSTSRELPTAWNWKTLPKEWGSARKAVLPHALAAVGAGAWSVWQNKQNQRVDVVATAQALGVQKTAFFMLIAVLRSGRLPKLPCPMVPLAPLAMPAVSAWVVSKAMNEALANQEEDLW